MISALALALRPVFEPLLKLRMQPPHLPEGSTVVRSLKPSEAYLGYRYLFLALSWLPQLAGLGVATAVLIAALGPWGAAIAVIGVATALVALGLSLVAVRLDWELRDYLIGDRSLRVRQGAIIQEEVTLSFANIQNIEVNQGPLERLFGFSNLQVTTAGGAAASGRRGQGSAHGAVLVGLAEAEPMRELLMKAVRAYRDAGLGDADDLHLLPPQALLPAALAEVLEAARELRAAAEATCAPVEER